VHTRRIATFLLGIWLGCSLWIDFLDYQGYHSAGLVTDRPTAGAAKILRASGPEQTQLLLRHFALEQTRYFVRLWQRIEILLALALGVFLFRATPQRAFPLFLGALMLVMVAFQYFALTPELAYQGRETDFPPGNAAVGSVARVWALQQVYAGVEAVKLLAGAVLAGYLFVYRTPRRGRKDSDFPETAQKTPRTFNASSMIERS